MNRRLPALALLLALAGCGGGADSPLAGARIGGPFTLTDENGVRVTDHAFAGRYRIMYFGYTFCPDICPTDAQAIGRGLKMFEQASPALGAKVVPIFVTVDPKRDTPAVLKEFTDQFHPRMIGLTGSKADIDAITKAYAISYSLEPPAPGGGYLVQHVRVTYLMGPDGSPIALLPSDQGPQAVADELKRWVK
ncbi:SCO family protein [Sphingomonas cannabina]|uniref:SCO family protein n=1 Tax=Sphingomonas cannabina TaxID=2899123 RepID=UPI001F210AF9|nr:SCO family protein [Sphingomonas cannabina]UIJ45708.1 SCO family protein [Sphingomonas cannabina]